MNGFKVLIGLGVLLCGQVWAMADVTTLETITAGQRDKVQAIVLQQQRNFADKCGVAKIIKATALSVMEPVTLGADGQPVSGRWNVRYSVDTCGVAGLRTVEMKVAGGGIAIEALVPGETLADATLQADVLKSFGMAATVAMPKCVGTLVVRETKMQVYPAGGKDRWQELWIGGMCGRDLAQVVEFMPTKGGTTFKMILPLKKD